MILIRYVSQLSIWGFAFTFILHLNHEPEIEKELKSEFGAGVEVSGGSDVTWIGPQVTAGWGEGR